MTGYMLVFAAVIVTSGACRRHRARPPQAVDRAAAAAVTAHTIPTVPSGGG